MSITVHTATRSYAYGTAKSYRVNGDGTLDVLTADVPHDPRAKNPLATFGPGQWVCAESGASTITSADSVGS
jgi:hypothetical protein